MTKTVEIIEWIRPMLPEAKTRYTMGVGLNPQDLLDVVAQGIDIFDCVAPTRNARHGTLYHGQVVPSNDWLKFESSEDKGRILIKKARYAKDESPILADCSCYTCKKYTRAYLHYLIKEDPLIYSALACIHNITLMHNVCVAMQQCIEQCACTPAK